MQININDNDNFDGLERAARIVALVMRMVVGLGLAVALVVKTYMLVLTDLTCDPAGTSLGNTIRCAPILDVVAASVLLITGLGLAAALISPNRIRLQETLTMGLCGVVIGFLSDVTLTEATWQTALVLMALFFPLLVLMVIRADWRVGVIRSAKTRNSTPD